MSESVRPGPVEVTVRRGNTILYEAVFAEVNWSVKRPVATLRTMDGQTYTTAMGSGIFKLEGRGRL